MTRDGFCARRCSNVRSVGVTSRLLVGFGVTCVSIAVGAFSVLPAVAQNGAKDQAVSELTGEVTKLKADGASKESIDSADQRLMDAERALLQSLSARAVANTEPAKKPAEKPAAKPAEKAPAKPEAVKPSAPAKAPVVPVAADSAPDADLEAMQAKLNQKIQQPGAESAQKPAASAPITQPSNPVKSIPAKAIQPSAPSNSQPSVQPVSLDSGIDDISGLESFDDETPPSPPAVKKAPAVAPAEKPAAPKPAVSASELQTVKNANANLRRDLESATTRIEALQRELDQTQSQLMLAETEVRRLSARIDSKNMASLGQYNLPSQQQVVAPPRNVARAQVPSRNQYRGDTRPPAANADLPVATVVVDKADLRVGPGRNNSALMAVRRGARLVVEHREGEWYRVFTPTGDRAWISADLVVFGDGAATLNDGSSVRVRGFDADVADEAFRKIEKSAAGR